MIIEFSGAAKIRHGQTGELFIINADILEWEVAGNEERGMGDQFIYEAVLAHEDLGQLRWTLGEYPSGIENYRHTDVGSHTLIRDIDYGLTHEPDFSDWVDYSAPDDPYTVFMDTFHHTGELLAELGSVKGDHLVNRMIFTQIIGALEAYLGDTLIKVVLDNGDAISKLLNEDKELIKTKFSLLEIRNSINLVEDKLREHLRGQIYHNLSKVDWFYRTAIGISIFSSKIDKEKLFGAILYRHDCVHRNGVNKDGQKLDVITKSYVQDISDELRQLVSDIQTQLRNRMLIQ